MQVSSARYCAASCFVTLCLIIFWAGKRLFTARGRFGATWPMDRLGTATMMFKSTPPPAYFEFDVTKVDVPSHVEALPIVAVAVQYVRATSPDALCPDSVTVDTLTHTMSAEVSPSVRSSKCLPNGRGTAASQAPKSCPRAR